MLEAHTGWLARTRACSKVKTALSARFDFTITVAAVYRFITAGLEGDHGVFATLGARCGKHLA